MEVGPLNPIRLPVEGPKEGQPGRASQVRTEGNRLIPEAARTKRIENDSLDVNTRGASVEELQKKVGISSTARDAILELLNSLKSSVGKEDGEEAITSQIDKAAAKTFNGKPVFDGRTLTHKKPDGSSIKVKMLGGEQLTEQVLPDLKDFLTGKVKEGKMFGEINRFYKQLKDFRSVVRNDLKAIVASFNNKASGSNFKGIETFRKAIEQAVRQGPENTENFKAFNDLSSKAVKLLK